MYTWVLTLACYLTLGFALWIVVIYLLYMDPNLGSESSLLHNFSVFFKGLRCKLTSVINEGVHNCANWSKMKGWHTPLGTSSFLITPAQKWTE